MLFEVSTTTNITVVQYYNSLIIAVVSTLRGIALDEDHPCGFELDLVTKELVIRPAPPPSIASTLLCPPPHWTV